MMATLRISLILALTYAIISPVLAQAKQPWEREVFFGEEHMHTRNSFDAFTIGVNQTWDDAYNYAKGKEVKLSTTGERMKKRTPYDFVAITDHAEYFGVLKEFANPASPLSKSDFAKGIVAGQTDPAAGGPAFKQLLASLFAGEPIPEYATPELRTSLWQTFLEAADKHYEPGKFTTLYAFEWTSIPNGSNMHRNVFFKDKAAAFPYSAFDSIYPEDLWTYLEIQREQGIDCFAIPHNSNVSNGWMFSEYEFLGNKMSERYARRQAANEPLFEIVQTKGQSEAHPALSPNDEFAGFELYDNLINLPIQADKSRGAFFRQGLATGMKLEKELGSNPYKMGVVAGADFHSGYQGNEEFNYNGGHGFIDDTPKKRLDPRVGLSGGVTAMLSTAGTTAVWAEENTRAGIFEAMKRKETYGTSGTMIRLRFFGGWAYPESMADAKDFAKQGYAGGVPMGQDLPSASGGAKAPTFAVQAMKDPVSGNLDRVQIIKVWANPANGLPMEKVYDVAWSGNRKHDRRRQTATGRQHGRRQDRDLHQRHRQYDAERRVDGSGFRSDDSGSVLRARPGDPDAALVDLRCGEAWRAIADRGPFHTPGTSLFVADLVHTASIQVG